MARNALLSPEQIMEALEPVQDPELRMSIVDLGLIYDVDIDEDGMVDVVITLTTPACPLGPLLIGQIQDTVFSPALQSVEQGKNVDEAWKTAVEGAQKAAK